MLLACTGCHRAVRMSTEYCAGVNCCTSGPCEDERPYRTHLRDDDSGVRPQDQCACIYHEDQKHPTECRKPAIICAGLVNSDIGVGSIGSSLLPQDARRENWTYDTRRNWTGHEVKSYQSAATPPWDMRQRGDYQRSMTYSSSDQPMQETISKYGDPYTRTFKVFHDRRGNLLDDGRQVFEYDALNRLTGVWESAKGGGQINPETGLPYNELELGTKGHPIAAFTYDGYGHRLTARYNVNDNAVLDDDPVDVYAYDRLWRVRTVTRATPSGSGAEATWTWYVREKWYYHDTESGQEMMTGPNSTDAPIMRLIDRNGDGDFGDAGEEQHFVNDHQGSTVLVTGKATLDPTNGNLIARAPIIAHVKYDQYGVPKFVHPADVNSDGVVDAADDTFWKQAWNEYVNGASGQTPPKEIWKGVADADEDGAVDTSADPVNSSLPSATNADWLAFHALHLQGMAQDEGYLTEQLGNLPIYAGYWWDEAIGLYHVRHRVYRPEWGRWLQRDPLGYAPGWNLYQYVNGMPWGSVDPMGLDAHGVGNLFRSMGLNWIGDVTDDFVDGAEVVRDVIRGNPGAATCGAVKGAVIGAAAGYLITEGIAATGPAAPVVGSVVLLGGTLYAAHQVDQLGRNWNNLSEEEQAERLGEFGGGLFGGMIGYKVARPTRAMPPGVVKQNAIEKSAGPRTRAFDENYDLGAEPLAGEPCPRPASQPTGSQYSVAYQTTLPPSSRVATRGHHFRVANEALLQAIQSDAALASQIEGLGIRIPLRADGGGATKSPNGWSWHHYPHEPGVLQLVPRWQHESPLFRDVLHPDGRGGYYYWGHP
jgi:RHS repeat-associated protein